MADPEEHPNLSGPGEVPECYACGESIEETSWVVRSGTDAGELLRVPDGEIVEVCDRCMDAVTGEVSADIADRLQRLGVDLDREALDD